MVTVSSAERAAGRLEPSTVKAVIAVLTRDGHALLHGALDTIAPVRDMDFARQKSVYDCKCKIILFRTWLKIK